MLKFFLIVGLVLYCIYKIGTLFFKAGAASQYFRGHQKTNFDPPPKEKKTSKFKGGEYVDYEEVK